MLSGCRGAKVQRCRGGSDVLSRFRGGAEMQRGCRAGERWREVWRCRHGAVGLQERGFRGADMELQRC